jgi:hypothetical protein
VVEENLTEKEIAFVYPRRNWRLRHFSRPAMWWTALLIFDAPSSLRPLEREREGERGKIVKRGFVDDGN